MNTQGWIRGLISYNSPLDKFVEFVCSTISKEFNFNINIECKNDIISLIFDNYKIKVSKSELTILQKTDPYALDKFLLEALKKQGFEFDILRSQYIKYCYGLV